MYTIPKKYANTLELNKILEMLSNEAALSDASQKALQLEINTDIQKVQSSLSETWAAYTMLAKTTSPSFGKATDNSPALARAMVGASLSFKELLEIGETLRSVRVLYDWRVSFDKENKSKIDYLFEKLNPNKYFEEKIFSCIKNEEDLNDDASVELKNIRRKIISAAANIRERLERIVRSQDSSKYLQETIITQRDGRFVVPVKAEYRGVFPGIVHDSSSSGATLFIEPMTVVEINNDLRVLRLKEKEEIERILAELSAEAATFGDAIISSYKALVELSLIFAKANLAYKQKATMPKINSDGRVVLKNARHPLISPADVVPISLTLGTDYNSLIITGPNTGGKTVTLKTIGLLTLMTMCGLLIPCDDMSEICIFDKILVDIGDEQSIEQSLSTFSSHMVNIVSILSEATPFSLILLDELGAGTDPTEGAALARAILDRLLKKGSRIAATTHYAELKSYAIEADRVENASCEFDVETLQPTYRLMIGVPGRSNAFAISKKLGIDEEIINNANSYISEEDKKFENIISALESERQKAVKEREKAESLRRKLTQEKYIADEMRKKAELDSGKIIEKARQQAENIIENTRYKSNALLNQLDDMRKEFNKENAAIGFSNASRTTRNVINAMMDEANPVENIVSDYVLPRQVVIGDNIKLTDLGKDGEIVEIKGEKIKVKSGNLAIWTTVDKIVLLENITKPKIKKQSVTGVKSVTERIATSEIDMRGMATDEGIIALDRFIDNAVMCGINTITIIHGKGTGVLRKAVQEHLRHHKSIKNFRVGLFGEGENGVTIAEINK